MSKPNIYIAGPDVFYPTDLQRGAELVQICQKLGANGIYPSFQLPPDLFTGNYSKEEASLIINRRCKEGIQQADILIVNFAPFRGHEMDSGTAFETGFGDALGKIIIGYSSNPLTYLDRMKKDNNAKQDEFGAWRDNDNNVIENFDLPDNCMISRSCLHFFKADTPELIEKVESNPHYLFEQAVKVAVLEFNKQLKEEMTFIQEVSQPSSKRRIPSIK